MSALARFLLLRRRAPAYGPELLNTSGASGTATAANWTARNAAVLTNPSPGILRIEKNGVPNNPNADQTNLTAGKRHRAIGQVRSDGNSTSNVRNTDSTVHFTSTASTDWQDYDIEFVATNAGFEIQTLTNIDTEYSEWRGMSVREVL